MDLKSYITKGIAEAGSLTALAEKIGVLREALTAANGGRRGLPPVACGKLADLVGASRWDVVAASEILTEKDETKRAYLLPFVHSSRKAAAWVMTAATTALIGTAAPRESYANDTFNVSAHSVVPLYNRVSAMTNEHFANYAKYSRHKNILLPWWLAGSRRITSALRSGTPRSP